MDVAGMSLGETYAARKKGKKIRRMIAPVVFGLLAAVLCTQPARGEGLPPRGYWRGHVWPVADWLLCWSLVRAGELERAEGKRQVGLKRLVSNGFAEHFEPFTGEPLGSDESWTAA